MEDDFFAYDVPLSEADEEWSEFFELDPYRVNWREQKKKKTARRKERFKKKSREMTVKLNKLKVMEMRVIEEGRADFNADEIYEMLFQAYIDARPGKRGTYDVQRVETNLQENLYRLATEIAERRYHPMRSEAFVVFDPVVREIFAAAFRDRVVHHLIFNICMPWWNRYFVRDSYSCRLGKGTDYGVRRAAYHIAVQSNNYTEPAYFVKMDIKGFFMSMERARLRELAVNGAHKQFPKFGPLGRLLAYLWGQVIMDDPLDGVRIRGHVRDWDNLPHDKSLFFQAKGHGIVIGNLTSQLLSNIFLDGLDKFMVYQLGYQHYGRYVDDFFVVVPERELEQVQKDVERVRAYLASMGLMLHPRKTKWIRVDKGVPYLGHFIKNGHIEMDRRYQGHYYNALQRAMWGKEDFDVVRSYMGGCSNYGCRKMQEKVWKAAGLRFEA